MPNSCLDPFSHQRVLHRRIHSDPVFSLPTDSGQAIRSRVISALPTSIVDGSVDNQPNSIPSISYLQSDDCGSYGSSYDSRGDLAEHTASQARPKPSRLPTAPAAETNRQSISSQITLIDEDDLFPDPLSTLHHPDDGPFSISSSSPMEQSVTTSTGDYPTRSKHRERRIAAESKTSHLASIQGTLHPTSLPLIRMKGSRLAHDMFPPM